MKTDKWEIRYLQFIFSLILVFFLGVNAKAQTDSLKVDTINKTNVNYQKYVINDDKLYAINDSGQVVIWDLNKLDTIHFGGNDTSYRFTAICKNKQNQIFVGTNRGNVYKINTDNLYLSLFLHDKYYIYDMCFSSDNKLFLIVPYAVYNPIRKKIWHKFKNQKNDLIYRKKVLGLFWKTIDTYFTIPQFTYLDDNDRWWMCSSYGEFGGDVQIFDTKNEKIYDNKFDSIKLSGLTPKSVFNDDSGNIYITSGLQHFLSSGEIVRIDKNRNAVRIFDSEDYYNKNKVSDTTNDMEKLDFRLFVGPGTYNKSDNSIYFATTRGFYKTSLPIKKKIKHFQFLFNPTLNWSREAMAIGVSMAIKQLDIINNNQIIFLTANDGIGIYKEGKLIMLK